MSWTSVPSERLGVFVQFSTASSRRLLRFFVSRPCALMPTTKLGFYWIVQRSPPRNCWKSCSPSRSGVQQTFLFLKRWGCAVGKLRLPEQPNACTVTRGKCFRFFHDFSQLRLSILLFLFQFIFPSFWPACWLWEDECHFLPRGSLYKHVQNMHSDMAGETCRAGEGDRSWIFSRLPQVH